MQFVQTWIQSNPDATAVARRIYLEKPVSSKSRTTLRSWAIYATLLLTPILASQGLPGSAARADQLTWEQRVINLLDQIIIVLEGTRAEISWEYPPPFDWGHGIALHGQLDEAVGRIDGLLDPTAETSLSSTDIGAIDVGFDPQNIQEYAKLCVNLAHAAAAEASRGLVMDVDLVATHLKTIRHFVERSGTHNYHSMIDINTQPSEP